MSALIEGHIECPFYQKNGLQTITCEGLLDNLTHTTHHFKSADEKRQHILKYCCQHGGRRCVHHRSVAILYERGMRE
jgi:hypothetical protein